MRACQSPNVDQRQSRDRCAQAQTSDVVIDCHIKELYYGTFKAVRDTADPDQEERDHRLHRPVRLRQEHGAALP